MEAASTKVKDLLSQIQGPIILFNEVFTLTAENLGPCFYMRMQKMSSINLVRSLKDGAY